MNKHVDVTPLGATGYPGKRQHKDNMHQLYQGDTFKRKFQLVMPDGSPINRDESRVLFQLTDRRIWCEVFFTAEWDDNIKMINPETGLVELTIPCRITEKLRRGSYHFSFKVSDLTDTERKTQQEGYIQVEYTATSPETNIPYRNGPFEDQTTGEVSNNGQ